MRKKTEGEMASRRVWWSYPLIIIILLSQSAFPGEIELRDKLSGVLIGSIRSITIGRQPFIPIEDFANVLSIQTTINSSAKKIDILYKQSKISFTAYTPFVQMDNVKLQMSAEVRFPNGDFYVPLFDMIKGFELTGINTLSFDADRQILFIVMLPPNITKVSTISEQDTLKLIIHAAKGFQKQDIETIQDKEWIYFNIKGGVIDISQDWRLENVPEIFEFMPAQKSMNEARLALHVAPNVTLDKIEIDSKNSLIIATLVSNNGISSSVFAELQKEQEKWKIDVIIIDPGHGGRDAGCSASSRIKEKNIALNIAQKLKDELAEKTSAKIILTRDRDKFIPLKGRTKNANQSGGKLFVSIHVDANRVKSLRGHTAYFLGPAKTDEARNVAQFENSVIQFEDSQNEYAGLSDASFILAANAQNSYNKESEELASIIDKKLENQCGSHSLGVRQAGFYVLYGASMPNVLVETGFITNSSDRQRLVSQSYQESLAEAIADGVIQFKKQYEKTNL
jgi:N-acetylmuramoyl-L-alanine amidase